MLRIDPNLLPDQISTVIFQKLLGKIRTHMVMIRFYCMQSGQFFGKCISHGHYRNTFFQLF